MSVSARALLQRSIFPFEQELRTARVFGKHFWCFSTFRMKNIHIFFLFLPAHSCYDQCCLLGNDYGPHAFYRKHFWCFSTLRTKNIHIILSVSSSALLLRSMFPFEQELRAARVLYKAFLVFQLHF